MGLYEVYIIPSQKCHYTQPRSFRPKGLEPKLSAVFAHWLACSTWAHVFLADYTTATACKGHVTKLGSLTDTALPFRRCNASRRRWLPATTAGLLQLVGTIWPVFFQLPLLTRRWHMPRTHGSAQEVQGISPVHTVLAKHSIEFHLLCSIGLHP